MNSKQARINIPINQLSSLNIRGKYELDYKIQELYQVEYEEIFSLLLNINIESHLKYMTEKVKRKLESIYLKRQLIPSNLNDILQSKQSNIKKLYQYQFKEFSMQWKFYTAKPSSFKELIKYRKHCPHTNQYALHECKRNNQTGTSRLIEISLNATEVTHVICIGCQEILSAKEMKLYCTHCNTNYYSSVLSKNENVDLLPATWDNYHCKRQINETMKCIKCFHVLFYDLNSLKLYCLNTRCNFTANPMSLIWKCSICQSDFQSNAKIFNPLEHLIYRKAIRSALLQHTKATPNYDCCKEERSYYHGRKCDGELFIGELNDKKIVVCGKCKALYSYDTFIWTCPTCLRKFSASRQFPHPKEKKSAFNFMEKQKANSETRSPKHLRFKTTANNDLISNLFKERSFQSFTLLATLNKNSESKTSEIVQEAIRPTLTFDEQKPVENKLKESKDFFEGNIITEEETVDDNEEGYYEYIRRMNCNNGNEERLGNIEEILNEKVIPAFELDDYEIIKKIGQGAYANIYEVTHLKTGEHYAMKKLITNDLGELQKCKSELELVYVNPHSNILTIFCLAIRQLDFSTFCIYIILELAECDWETQIKKYQNTKKKYSENEIMMILRQLTEGLAYLQSKGISHRDIKPQNILVFPNGIYKLSDFGEAKSVKRARELNTLKGTEMFMSPILYKALQLDESEVLHNSYKSDVFSLGLCFLYAMTFSFELINIFRTQEEPNNKLLHSLSLSSNHTQIFMKMLSRNERERFDFISLLEQLKNDKSK